MKKFTISSLITLLAASAFADTYYLNVKDYAGGDIYLSNSLSYTNKSGETDYFWYSDSTYTTPCTTLPSFVADSEGNRNDFYIYAQVNIVVDTPVQLGTLYLMNDNVRKISSNSTDNIIDIQTIKLGAAYSNAFIGSNTIVKYDTISIQNGTCSFGNVDSPIKQLVTGNLLAKTHSADGNYSAFYVTGVENHSVDNPDAVIGRLFSNNDDIFRTMISYGLGGPNKTREINANSYAWVNKITDKAGILVQGATTSTGVFTVVMTHNEADTSSIGNLWEGYYDKTNKVYEYKDGGAKLALVMRSSTANVDGSYTYHNYSQTFTSDQLYFTGGVKMISGKVYMNYNAVNQGDATHIGHGTLAFAKAAAAQSATFGSSSDIVGGTFMFNDMTVADDGGTIQIRMDIISDQTLFCDQIGLLGKATGTGTILLDLRSASNGVNIDDYVDYMIENRLSLKVVSWTGEADSSILFTTNEDYKVYNYNGTDYLFTTNNALDGLYVSYTQVPEPATVAAIFGALALAFAAYRRRK